MEVEQLQTRLDEIRAWRKLELSHARSLAERHRGSAEFPYLCRVWTMMIYAHCDQAVKLISKEYLSFLKATPRQSYDYKTVWLAFFGKEALREVADHRYLLCRTNDRNSNDVMLNNITAGKEVFDSKNFSFPLLRFFTEWIIQADFDYERFRGFCFTLKNERDKIAHGEMAVIEDVERCLAWHDPAIELLDAITDAAINAALEHQ
ncbi:MULTISPECIES: MAE_28990/MAE_18760 family HEPN-like nuclease [Agrobacterium]|uniref:MAE_28990/MAE_18760 family HEPN-like nuclease n=1 Tax=Agrobacterium TaxID=357 RepID=UPI002785E1FB|nr:MAE_28990/MAE_18760 family HEPN-like nuclease [Agrobacterium sp. SORGH_AS_0745]MDP9758335.1 hypothetical protein [Agrobacterium tumefaciens]MDQ1219574.1 hypothetical protein [Agrobacterium sp. SORGH_AS_0745]